MLDRDEQVRGVIRLIFDKFDELGSARRVLVYLVRNDIRLGFRWNRGPRRGQLDWRLPRYGTVLRVLTHPTYAGAYVFGRKDPPGAEPATGAAGADRNRFRATAWAVLLKDRLPAYISWDRYEANQERLPGEPVGRGLAGGAAGRRALLAGLAVCGSCGRRLTPQYPRRGRPYYWCTRHLQDIQDQTCHGLTAGVVDRLVVDQVHEALKPAGLKLSLRAIADGRAERERLDGHWERELERARYEAQRAGRQYQAVEPENRLVARTLEQRWEAALAEVRRLEEEFARFARDRPARLTEAERSRILALSADIPALWGAASTTNADRKEVIRCLVDRVVVHVRQNTEYCDVTIHWKGGCTSEHEVIRPVRSRGQLRDGDRLRAARRRVARPGTRRPRPSRLPWRRGVLPAAAAGGLQRTTGLAVAAPIRPHRQTRSGAPVEGRVVVARPGAGVGRVPPEAAGVGEPEVVPRPPDRPTDGPVDRVGESTGTGPAAAVEAALETGATRLPAAT